MERPEYSQRFLKSKAIVSGSILTVFSSIVLLCISSIIMIIIIIILIIIIINNDKIVSLNRRIKTQFLFNISNEIFYFLKQAFGDQASIIKLHLRKIIKFDLRKLVLKNRKVRLIRSLEIEFLFSYLAIIIIIIIN